MSRRLGCRSQQEDLRRRALLGCWIFDAPHGGEAEVASGRDLDPAGEGRHHDREGQGQAAAHAAVHAEVDARAVPPRGQLALLHDPDGALDGVRSDLLPRLHADVRHRLLLRSGEPGDEPAELLQRSRPCHRMAAVVSIQVAGASSAVAWVVRAAQRRAGDR